MAARIWWLLPLILVACAESAEQPVVHDGVEAHSRKDGFASSLKAQRLFHFPLRGINSREHFVIEARFVQDQGLLLVHSHFNGYAWRDGVRIGFRREGSHLHLELGTPGFPPKIHELSENFLDASGTLRVRLEVHDGLVAGGVRVLVWQQLWSLQGNVEKPRPLITSQNADFDSHALNWTFYSHGRGAFWGIETENVQLLEARREAPYVD